MALELSIIIPAFNEEDRIEKSLETAENYLINSGYNFEIIVVDDGSSDETAQKVKGKGKNIKLISLPSNMGKGAAVRHGMLAAEGEIRIFTDADFSTPIHEIEKLIKLIRDGADICIGSRAIDPSMIKEHQPFYREYMGKTFNKIVQILLFKGIKDTQCGFKGFKSQSANLIFNAAKINGFSFDVEILFLATRKGLNITQVPVEWYNDNRSKVNPIKDSIIMLVELFKIRKIHRSK